MTDNYTREILASITATAAELEAPVDYFQGLRWQKSFLPDNILSFTRGHQVHDLSGWEGISEKSGKYDQHGRFVLLIFLNGGGSVGIEQNSHILEEGDALLVFPHQLHYYLRIPEEFSWLYITFELPAEATEPIQGLRDSPRAMNEECLALLREFLASYRRTVKGWELGVALVLRNFLLRLNARPPKTEPEETGSASIVRHAKTFIFNHLDTSFSLADIAKEVGYSESYLRARFKDEVGISLWQFILAAKVSHAAFLLRTTDHKIGAISKACGFDSQLSFARAFKRAFGFSPRQYRQKQNQTPLKIHKSPINSPA